MFYILDNGKKIMIPDSELEHLQTKYNISMDEAIYTWLVDEDFIKDETVETFTQKAKENRITATIHQARKQTEQKERKPREKKENLLKKAIINALCDGLEANIDKFNANEIHFSVTNDEKYINLTIDNTNFTINLVQHREKK